MTTGTHHPDDERYMARALELAAQARGLTSPNPLVGAVYVRDGVVLGEGYHKGRGRPHAEIEALEAAGGNVAGATLYINLEPCCHHGRTPPCTDALIRHHVKRVVAAIEDPNPLVAGQGLEQLRLARVEVESGLFAAEAARLNETFLVYHQQRRPFLLCKWAMTLDGKIATESGHSQWITNDKSRAFVHAVRGEMDGVMVGIGTVLVDNPLLTVRLPGYTGRQPMRIIVDGNLRIPLRARCLENAEAGQCIIATTSAGPADRAQRLRDAGHTVLTVKGRRGIVDLRDLMTALHRLEVQSILIEGGSTLLGSFLKERLHDKFLAFVAPKLVGGTGARSPITGWSVSDMTRALELRETCIRTFDGDVAVEGYPVFPEGDEPEPPPPVRRPDSEEL